MQYIVWRKPQILPSLTLLGPFLALETPITLSLLKEFFTNKLTNQLILIDNYNQEIVPVQDEFTQTQLQEPYSRSMSQVLGKEFFVPQRIVFSESSMLQFSPHCCSKGA